MANSFPVLSCLCFDIHCIKETECTSVWPWNSPVYGNVPSDEGFMVWVFLHLFILLIITTFEYTIREGAFCFSIFRRYFSWHDICVELSLQLSLSHITTFTDSGNNITNMLHSMTREGSIHTTSSISRIICTKKLLPKSNIWANTIRNLIAVIFSSSLLDCRYKHKLIASSKVVLFRQISAYFLSQTIFCRRRKNVKA